MVEKQEFWEHYSADGVSMSELCRQFRISRKTGYQWLRGFAQGWDGSARRRGRRAWVIERRLARQILEWRERYPFEGPRKLVTRLELEPGQSRPAASTVGDFLRRNGLTMARRRRRRCWPNSQPFIEVKAPNDEWCTDLKGWFRTLDGQRCDVLTVSDSFSRYLLACELVRPAGYEQVRSVFERLFHEHGLPRAIRSDNGVPFASVGVGGLSRLSGWWLRLGIRPQRIAPGHPEQNGRHERMHRTLKQQACAPPADNPKRQAVRLKQFCEYYNCQRPHEALAQRPPAAVYRESTRRYPAQLATPQYSAECEVRRVRSNGEIKWRGGKLFVSEALVGELVAISRSASGNDLLRFCDLTLGVLEHAQRRIRPVPVTAPSHHRAQPQHAPLGQLKKDWPSRRIAPRLRIQNPAAFRQPSDPPEGPAEKLL